MNKIALVLLLLVGILNRINCLPDTCKAADMTAADDDCTTEPYCKIEFNPSTGARTTGECSATCDADETTACCDTDNCNDVADGTNSHSCYQCSTPAECLANSAKFPCSSSTHTGCKTVFENGEAISKSCVVLASCTSSKTTACVAIGDDHSANKLKTCYQCSGSGTTAGECGDSSLEPTACAEPAVGCYTEYDNAGDVIAKGCALNINGDEDTQEMCYDDDCNTKTSLLSCFVCTDADECDAQEEGDDVFCYASISDVCKTEFNASGIAVRKSCAWAGDCSPDELTSCCSEDGCNSATSIQQSCFQCEDFTSCRLALPTPCATENATICKSMYDSNDMVFSKECVETCTDGVSAGITTSCCDGEACNDVNVFSYCYQCDDQASCTNEDLEATSCESSSEDVCYTIFLNGVAQEKGCVAHDECIEGVNGTLSSSCCHGDGCNEDIYNSGNGKYSTNLLAASILSLLISFKRYLN